MVTSEFTILVVDDELIMRKTLGELLRLEGYQVMTASNGDEAIQLISGSLGQSTKETFDLILLDLKMPGRDGLDVLRKTVEVSPETQVILLTAHGSLQSAIEALRQGARDYLLKPASPDQILASVRHSLEQRVDQRRRKLLLEQLEASIQALSNPTSQIRTGWTELPSALNRQDDQGTLKEIIKGINLDLAKRIISKDETRIYLTPGECKLLEVFLNNPNRVMTHRELVARVQGYEVSDREAPSILRPLISRLRQKLSHIPESKNWVASIRATGYIFQVTPPDPFAKG